ncbi:MAG: CapA family protein [Bacillota bacterium]|nr:CapA family protein [Bacillota bacterium]
MGECEISGGYGIRPYCFVFAAVILVLLGLGLLLFSAARSNSNNTITLAAAGDILLDRGVRVQLEQHGYEYSYAWVKDILHKADIAFANLESPLAAGGTAVFKDRTLLFRGDLENAAALKDAGFTILSLANNHTMDYGSEGLSSTLDVLGSSSILSLGGGVNAEEARQPVYITSNGGVIGFLGYSVFPPEGYVSFPHREEIARVNIEFLPEEIAKAKRSCDFLVLSFHWGREYDFFPSEQQGEEILLRLQKFSQGFGTSILIREGKGHLEKG